MIFCFLDFYYIFRIWPSFVLYYIWHFRLDSLPYFKFIGDSVEATLTIEDLLRNFFSFFVCIQEKKCENFFRFCDFNRIETSSLYFY